MSRALAAVIALAPAIAFAQDAPPPDVPAAPTAPTTPEQSKAEQAAAHREQAREHYERGEYDPARADLEAAYALEPTAATLFALGQVEFNLKRYDRALHWYQEFLKTNPNPEQSALAEQAIGATRIQITLLQQPPPPPPHREWDNVDSALVLGGGVAMLAGGGLVAYNQHLARDHSGTLAAYDHRVSRAETARLAAGGCFAASAIAVGAALLRWRLRLVDTTVEVHPTQGGATVTLELPL